MIVLSAYVPLNEDLSKELKVQSYSGLFNKVPTTARKYLVGQRHRVGLLTVQDIHKARISKKKKIAYVLILKALFSKEIIKYKLSLNP